MRCVSICPVHARKVSQLKTSVAADESVMVDGKVDMFKSTPSHLTLTPTAIIKSPSVWAKHSEMA